MDVKDQVRLKFYGVDIVDLHFTSKAIYPKNSETKVGVKINPKVFYPKDNKNIFKILMDVSVEAKDFFEINLFATGNFALNQNIIPELKAGFINTNAPAIMLPYVRSFITTLTSNLGNPTGSIVLPPQFIGGDLEEVDLEDF